MLFFNWMYMYSLYSLCCARALRRKRGYNRAHAPRIKRSSGLRAIGSNSKTRGTSERERGLCTPLRHAINFFTMPKEEHACTFYSILYIHRVIHKGGSFFFFFLRSACCAADMEGENYLFRNKTWPIKSYIYTRVLHERSRKGQTPSDYYNNNFFFYGNWLLLKKEKIFSNCKLESIYKVNETWVFREELRST